jgi:hypothetical protein
LSGAGFHAARDGSLCFVTSKPNCQGSFEQAPTDLLVNESAASYNLSERGRGVEKRIIAVAFNSTENPPEFAMQSGFRPAGFPFVLGRPHLCRSSWRVDEVQQPSRGSADADILT